MNLALSTKTKLMGLLFVLPSLLFLFAFFVYPILRSVYISFFDYSVGRDLIFSGLSNYAAILTDQSFWHAGYITLRYAVSALVLELVGGLIFALTYSRLKGHQGTCAASSSSRWSSRSRSSPPSGSTSTTLSTGCSTASCRAWALPASPSI